MQELRNLLHPVSWESNAETSELEAGIRPAMADKILPKVFADFETRAVNCSGFL